MLRSYRSSSGPATLTDSIPDFISVLPLMPDMPGTTVAPVEWASINREALQAACGSHPYPSTPRAVFLTPSAGAKILSAAGELSPAELPTTCPPFEFWLLKKLDKSVCVFDYWVRSSECWDTEGILSDLSLAKAETEQSKQESLECTGSSPAQRGISYRE
ncbi:hypothetical protein FOL47_001648 [Perkinsus chesapeaki]|uniref:Uncharacterized protein n=1 Tax=Perkinsus chesapeaki TaxID=330153 RepID=A0A7J6N132_PERCH|nr:hypothetical protein FOL47_001648 [Perkinsus chesapeaki]